MVTVGVVGMTSVVPGPVGRLRGDRLSVRVRMWVCVRGRVDVGSLVLIVLMMGVRVKIRVVRNEAWEMWLLVHDDRLLIPACARSVESDGLV